MARLIWLVTAAVLAIANAQGKVGEQCGGNGWTGSTSCEEGLTCVYNNESSSECVDTAVLETQFTMTTQKITRSSSSTSSRSSTSSTSTRSSRTTKSTAAPSPTASDVIVPPAATGIRVRMMPASLLTNGWKDEDWSIWGVTPGTTASTTIGNVSLSLTSSNGTFKGAQYKFVYFTFVPSFGQRLVGAGISTDLESANLTLTFQGLSPGSHSLLTYNNAWDSLPSAANISITVDGETVVVDKPQSIRVNNIWNAASTYLKFSVSDPSQIVTIVFTPGPGGNKRAFLNGFELDHADISNIASFPEPPHKEEHVGQGSQTTVSATWRAPAGVAAPRYNVYLSEDPVNAMVLKSSQQTATSINFSGLSSFPIYWWRVDTVDSDGSVFQGRPWKFRIAQLAFPGAEGWGRFARGGRGGKVVKVTSLADSGPGTLRNALTVETGPRTVVFDVGGVIKLESRVSVSDDFVTLAGQTAPGKGIAVIGWPIGLTGTSDVIFRHLRVRPGKVSNKTVDGMGMQGSNHAIFDRCSMGWSIDESFSSRSAWNITFQRNLISEPLNIAGHQNYPIGTAHGYAGSIGGDVGSFHHNLIAHAFGRSWSMAGGLDNNAVHSGRLDIRNNVVYNFGHRVTDGGTRQGNFVGNLYKPGPASDLKYDFAATYENDFGPQQYYCDGNSMPGYFTQDSLQYVEGGGNAVIACWANIKLNPPPTFQKFFPQPFFDSYVTTQTSTEAYKRVLSDSGVSSPVQDNHDARIISETFFGNTTYTGSVGGLRGIIDHENDVGGLEDFPTTTRPADWDANGDGIADWWDGSTGGNGYTPLEGYLNFLADPHAFVAPSKTVTIPLAQYGAGFPGAEFVVKSAAKKGKVTIQGSTATYTAGAKACIDSFTFTIKDNEGSAWDRKLGVAIFEGAA